MRKKKIDYSFYSSGDYALIKRGRKQIPCRLIRIFEGNFWYADALSLLTGNVLYVTPDLIIRPLSQEEAEQMAAQIKAEKK